MDSEMRSLTDLLHQISTGPISKIREMRHLAKRVLSPVLPEDPSMTLTSPPEVAVTKGQKKTNSTKRDNNWKNTIGDGNCGYQVVVDFVFSDEHQWLEVRRRMLYELEHSMNVYLNLVGSEVRVNELVHRIYWPVNGPAPCMMDVRYLLYTFNGFIIVPNESAIGQIHIRIGLQIGMRGLLEIESKQEFIFD
ncbi:hypothetical protein M9H77_30622 [Catharanthus roseus]|uniref:Uncharacterized protein n=1 Tax=Catharanthus roseus TaxID=4058 RepID=A0ACB9ZZL7_CATRO|nr:hypothetical protein M9H77_30622 [Catharanthus roseus]